MKKLLMIKVMGIDDVCQVAINNEVLEKGGNMSDKIDLLNRREFVERVIKVVNQLSEIKKGCCFAIEGSWGIGKTFVIEEIETQLKIIQSDNIHSDRFFVFHYNCWKHDYYDEPSIAIISAMIASVFQDEIIVDEKLDASFKIGYKLVRDKLKEIAGIYIQNKIGVDVISVLDDTNRAIKQSEQDRFEFDQLFNFSQTIEAVRDKLKEIAKERTLVLVVDELDRCIPEYAIRVLERLHHIFYGLENVIVIMAVDRKQLEHSVIEMFGAGTAGDGINIEKYLKKFIDFSMVLDRGTINESIAEKYKFYFERFWGEENDNKRVSELVSRLYDGINIRQQEKIVEKANMVHSIICKEKVDVSVLLFELMYERIQLVSIGSLKNIALINKGTYPQLEQGLGRQNVEMIKSLMKEAFINENTIYFNGKLRDIVEYNLGGKMMWYFSNVFNIENIPHNNGEFNEQEMVAQTKIVKDYVEFCKIVK